MFVRKGLSTVQTRSQVQRKCIIRKQPHPRFNSSSNDKVLQVDCSVLTSDVPDFTETSIDLERDKNEDDLEASDTAEEAGTVDVADEETLSSIGSNAKHIKLSSTGEWVDVLNVAPLSALTMPANTRVDQTQTIHNVHQKMELFEQLRDFVPTRVMDVIRPQLETYAKVASSSDPTMLKYVPLRDRLQLAIGRIHPLLLRHIYSQYTKFSRNVELVEFRELPRDQLAYIFVLCKFLDMKVTFKVLESGLYECKVYANECPHVPGGISRVNLPKDMQDDIQKTILDLHPKYKLAEERKALQESIAAPCPVNTMVSAAVREMDMSRKTEYAGYTVYDAESPATPMPIAAQHINRPKELPAHAVRDVFLNLLNEKQVVMVVGSTGSGKSTQLPQFVFDHFKKIGKPCHIWLTQPRRVAAVSICKRIMHEQGVDFESRFVKRLQETPEPGYFQSKHNSVPVGYVVRGEHYMTPNTQLVVCTIAILLKKIVSAQLPKDGNTVFVGEDPRSEAYWTHEHSILVRKAVHSLRHLTHVFIDEVHEGSTTADMLQSILRDALPHLPHLKVVLMSATANTNFLTRYLNIDSVLSLTGRMYPVDVFYEEDINAILSDKDQEEVQKRRRSSLESFLAEEYMNGKTYTSDADRMRLEATLKYTKLSMPMHMGRKIDGPLESNGASPELLLRLQRNITRNFEAPSKLSESKYTLEQPSGVESKGEIPYISTTSSLPEAHNLVNEIEKTPVNEEVITSEEARQYSSKLMDQVVASMNAFELTEPGMWKHKQPKGTILIFSPTWSTIVELLRNLRNDEQFGDVKRFRIVPMHSTLNLDHMLRAIVPVEGVITIVIATNIAETSLTIPDVACVIDQGNGLTEIVDSIEGASLLPLEFTPTSSMNQRRGRAGRTRPAICFRVFSKEKVAHLPRFPRPAALVHNAENSILHILSLLQGDTKLGSVLTGKELIHLFNARLPTRMNSFHLDTSYDKLVQMGFVDDAGILRNFGRMALRMSLDVNATRVVTFGLLYGCLDAALTVAAYLSHPRYLVQLVESQDNPGQMKSSNPLTTQAREIFGGDQRSEFVTAINIFNAYVESGCSSQFCEEYGISQQVMRNWQKSRQQTFYEIQMTHLKYMVENLRLDKVTSRMMTLPRSQHEYGKLSSVILGNNSTDAAPARKTPNETIFLEKLDQAHSASLSMPMSRVPSQAPVNIEAMLRQKLKSSTSVMDSFSAQELHGNTSSLMNARSDVLKHNVLHANLLGEKEYYVENVIHAAMYPNIGVSRSSTLNSTTYRCRQPMNHIGENFSSFMEKYVNMSPQLAYSTNSLKKGHVYMSSNGMFPSHALLQTCPGDQPRAQQIERRFNSLVEDGIVLYNIRKHMSSVSLFTLNALLLKGVEKHEHAAATVEELLDAILWDVGMSPKQRLEHIHEDGTIRVPSGIHESGEILGLVGMYEEQPSLEHVLSTMNLILKDNRLLPNTVDDYSELSSGSKWNGVSGEDIDLDWHVERSYRPVNGSIQHVSNTIVEPVRKAVQERMSSALITKLNQNPAFNRVFTTTFPEDEQGPARTTYSQPMFAVAKQFEYLEFQQDRCRYTKSVFQEWVGGVAGTEMLPTEKQLDALNVVYNATSQMVVGGDKTAAVPLFAKEIEPVSNTQSIRSALLLHQHYSHYSRNNESKNRYFFESEIHSVYALAPVFHKRGLTVEQDAQFVMFDSWLGLKTDKASAAVLALARDTFEELFGAASKTAFHGSNSYHLLTKLWRQCAMLSEYNASVVERPRFTGVQARTPLPLLSVIKSANVTFRAKNSEQVQIN